MNSVSQYHPYDTPFPCPGQISVVPLSVVLTCSSCAASHYHELVTHLCQGSKSGHSSHGSACLVCGLAAVTSCRPAQARLVQWHSLALVVHGAAWSVWPPAIVLSLYWSDQWPQIGLTIMHCSIFIPDLNHRVHWTGLLGCGTKDLGKNKLDCCYGKFPLNK